VVLSYICSAQAISQSALLASLPDNLRRNVSLHHASWQER